MQLNRQHDYGSVRDNQLRTLSHIGLFSKPLTKPTDKLEPLPDPFDATKELESRARAYLHVNCSACHMQAGGGNSQMELTWNTARDQLNLIGARPQHDTFGIANAMLVAPQDPDRSVLVQRLSRRGPGQMPPLVSRQVDVRAVRLFREWISQLQPARAFVKEWQMEDFAGSLLEQLSAGRSFTRGHDAFKDTGCAQCHRLGDEGGTVGPDLKGVAKRLAPRDLLESILHPSKVIPDEYAGVVIETASGRVITGRIEREDARTVAIRPYLTTDELIELPAADVVARRRSDISNMPAGTANVLKQDEILDLLAYLLSDGNPEDPRFEQPAGR
jgi:putative heme-binding domain-containing protein